MHFMLELFFDFFGGFGAVGACDITSLPVQGRTVSVTSLPVQG